MKAVDSFRKCGSNMPAADDIPVNHLCLRSAEISRLLKALANERRLKLLCAIAEHGDLAAVIGCTQSGTSQHLSWLKNQGLVISRVDGQFVYYALPAAARKVVADLLAITKDGGGSG